MIFFHKHPESICVLGTGAQNKGLSSCPQGQPSQVGSTRWSKGMTGANRVRNGKGVGAQQGQGGAVEECSRSPAIRRHEGTGHKATWPVGGGGQSSRRPSGRGVWVTRLEKQGLETGVSLRAWFSIMKPAELPPTPEGLGEPHAAP